MISALPAQRLTAKSNSAASRKEGVPVSILVGVTRLGPRAMPRGESTFANTGKAASTPSGAMLAATGLPPEAFVMHHTGGGRTPADIQNTLRQRGLGVEYIMDRDGNITVAGKPGAANILPGWGKGAGLNNKNIVGMEVIAKDNKDVTPKQIEFREALHPRKLSKHSCLRPRRSQPRSQRGR